MSTRCQIGIYENQSKKLEEFEALLYRHSDGYPSGVLPDIMPFLSWWAKGRGISDSEYVSARLLQYLCNKYDGHSIQWAKEMDKNATEAGFGQKISDIEDFTGIYGHGICKQFHWDIEYFYSITPEAVEVYEVNDVEKMNFTLLGRIPYENYEKSKDYKKLTKES